MINSTCIKRVEIVVSPIPLIWDTIQDQLSSYQNLNIESVFLNNIDEIEQYKKIDLLIVDGDYSNSFNRFRIKTTVIFNHNAEVEFWKGSNEQVKFSLPCRLSHLLELVINNRARQQIFCCINNQWIYDQQCATIVDNQIKCKLTEKENEVIAAMIKADNYQINKEDLLKNIWQYHPESDSSTIEAHLHRLKQKLPANLLQYKENYYRLAITNIE
ncbi:winged helix-turn-helix domain-containing protein [Candidatus Trichorickettsia mobilis]|uniref:winged helix-turn-helix domain-containing protein n=1 Tax=Candidatus Trichorickettsia mobilis TaxID=1346319 RepID=UPI00292E38A2|nr:winged helix-turn-helix domain-containing protein [Candidatus Trichorickettsia mobilis]